MGRGAACGGGGAVSETMACTRVRVRLSCFAASLVGRMAGGLFRALSCCRPWSSLSAWAGLRAGGASSCGGSLNPRRDRRRHACRRRKGDCPRVSGASANSMWGVTPGRGEVRTEVTRLIFDGHPHLVYLIRCAVARDWYVVEGLLGSRLLPPLQQNTCLCNQPRQAGGAVL